MALNGSLSDFSVLETLQLVGLQKKTGSLFVESGRHRLALHFRDGFLLGCQARRAGDHDPFFQTLTGLGLLSEEEARRVRAAALEADADPWAEVQKFTPLSEETLRETRRLAQQGALDRILLWNRGKFAWSSANPPYSSEAAGNTEQTLLESMRRLDEAADLRGGDFPPHAVPIRLGHADPETVLAGEEDSFPTLTRAVLRRIDGKRNLSDLVKQLGVAEYDVLTCVRALRLAREIRIDLKAKTHDSSQILIEQPARLERPTLVACACLIALALGSVGFGMHALTERWSGRLARALEQERSQYETLNAARAAVEAHRARTGSYPASLDAMLASGVWPSKRAAELQDFRYALRAPDYELVSIHQSAAPSKSSTTASGR